MISGASTTLATLERPVLQEDSSTVILDSVDQFLSQMFSTLSPTLSTSQLHRHPFPINVNSFQKKKWKIMLSTLNNLAYFYCFSLFLRVWKHAQANLCCWKRSSNWLDSQFWQTLESQWLSICFFSMWICQWNSQDLWKQRIPQLKGSQKCLCSKWIIHYFL